MLNEEKELKLKPTKTQSQDITILLNPVISSRGDLQPWL